MLSEQSLGEALRRERRLRGISQEAAGDILGTSQVNVGRWETDVVRPSQAKWGSIAEFLHCSYGDVQDAAGGSPMPAASNHELFERLELMEKRQLDWELQARAQDKKIAELQKVIRMLKKARTS